MVNIIVDPNTGEPLSLSTTQAKTVGGQVGMDVTNTLGISSQEAPLWYDLLGNLPSASTTMLWNTGRVTNTLRKGPRVGLRARGPVQGLQQVGRNITGRNIRGMPGYERYWARGNMGISGGISRRPFLPTQNFYGGGLSRSRGLRQTFSPFAFNRLATPENISPLPGSGTYSPFNILAKSGNAIMRGLAKTGNMDQNKILGGVGRTVSEKIFNPLNKWFAGANAGGEYFETGSLGRLAAMGDVSRMSQRNLLASRYNIARGSSLLNREAYTQWYNSRQATFPAYFKQPEVKYTLPGGGELGRIDVMQTIANSYRTPMMQKFAGYSGAAASEFGWVRGVEKGSGNLFARGLVSEAGKAGAQSAISDIAAGGAKMRMAQMVGGLPVALRVAGPVSKALLIRDAALLLGKTAASIGSTVLDAGKSIQGDISKPIMGGVYKDTMIAATSRQRAVMAISNSQLNMRSVLGNEASGIHAAWG